MRSVQICLLSLCRADLTVFHRDATSVTMCYPTTVDPRNVPSPLHGLWWKRGSPAPDYFLSFGEGLCTNSTYCELNVFQPGVWSWHRSVLGRLFHSLAQCLRLYYVFHLHADQTRAHIVPRSRLVSVGMPRSILAFDMYRDLTMDPHGHVWVRNSTILGAYHHQYNLTRIIDADGAKTAYFQRYQAETETIHLITRRARCAKDELLVH